LVCLAILGEPKSLLAVSVRDQEIHNKMLLMNRRVSLFYKQLVFLDCRMQAFESVLQNTNWMQRTFDIHGIMKRIDSLHLALMQKHDDELRLKEEEMKNKPNLTIVHPDAVVPKARYDR
jgi:hypothetical protein